MSGYRHEPGLPLRCRSVLQGLDEPAKRGNGRVGEQIADAQGHATRGHATRIADPRDDLRPLYAAADCLLLPTRYDPFPNTALEALAMGVPVIVSRRCGAAEIVEPGVSGWI